MARQGRLIALGEGYAPGSTADSRTLPEACVIPSARSKSMDIRCAPQNHAPIAIFELALYNSRDQTDEAEKCFLSNRMCSTDIRTLWRTSRRDKPTALPGTITPVLTGGGRSLTIRQTPDPNMTQEALVKDRGVNVVLRDVTKENWYQCTKLKVSEAQRALFPAPVVYWIAESKFEDSFRLLAIYHQETLVGFCVYGYDVADGEYWISALMIDEHHQGKGYGKAALRSIISLLTERHGCRSIKIGHRPHNTVAAKLYESLGFRVIGHTEKEIIRRLDMDGTQA
jgi:diamine N-acetyltransferase